MARKVTLDTRTWWTIPIPDDVKDEDKVQYAWDIVLKIAERLSKKEVKVRTFVPDKYRRR